MITFSSSPDPWSLMPDYLVACSLIPGYLITRFPIINHYKTI